MAGTSLGSSPLIAAATPMEYYQVHESSTGGERPDVAVPLPDHYPLVTREGVVPVHELSQRGLYRQARYGGLYGPASGAVYDPATVEAHYERVARHYDEDSERMSEERFERAVAPTAAQEATSTPPLALADGPVVLAASGGRAKIVNVAEALATP